MGFFKQWSMKRERVEKGNSGTGKGKRRVENILSLNGGQTNTMLTQVFDI